MVLLVVDDLPGIDGTLHGTPGGQRVLHQEGCSHIVTGDGFRELHVVGLVGIDDVQLAIVQQEVAVVAVEARLRIVYVGCRIEHRAPIVHRHQTLTVQTIEVLVGGHEIGVLRGLTGVGALDETGLTIEVVALRGAVVLIRTLQSAVDEHQVGGEHLDVGLPLTLGEQIESALRSTRLHGQIGAKAVVAHQTIGGVLGLAIEKIGAGSEVAGPLQVLFVADGIGRRIDHGITNLLGTIAVIVALQHKPTVTQPFGMGVGHFQEILYLIACRHRIDGVGIQRARRVHDELYLAHLAVRQVVVVAIVLRAGDTECTEQTEGTEYAIKMLCNHNFQLLMINYQLETHQIAILIGQRMAGMSSIVVVQCVLETNAEAVELCPRHRVGGELAHTTGVLKHETVLYVAIRTKEWFQLRPVVGT